MKGTNIVNPTTFFKRQGLTGRIAGCLLAALLVAVGGCGFSMATGGPNGARANKILNVSYDPTRELYREFNEAFAAHWQETTGQSVTIQQSHGGSGS